jgi:hypothetical protein
MKLKIVPPEYRGTAKIEIEGVEEYRNPGLSSSSVTCVPKLTNR